MKKIQTFLAVFLLIFLTTACEHADSATHSESKSEDALPFEFDPTEFCTAIELKAKSMGRSPAAWIEMPSRWPRTKLTVKFLGGSPALQQRVMKEANQWSQQCGIVFTVVPTGYADIRVSFEKTGHWSVIGIGCLLVDKSKATMNLELTNLSSDEDVRRVTLHEFGHAIGLSHEHQHPEGKIAWNEKRVLAFYRKTQGWNEAKTRLHVLTRSNSTNFDTSGFDKTSIMIYPIPKALTTDGFSTGLNTKLSPQDIELVARVYPPLM